MVSNERENCSCSRMLAVCVCAAKLPAIFRHGIFYFCAFVLARPFISCPYRAKCPNKTNTIIFEQPIKMLKYTRCLPEWSLRVFVSYFIAYYCAVVPSLSIPFYLRREYRHTRLPSVCLCNGNGMCSLKCCRLSMVM